MKISVKMFSVKIPISKNSVKFPVKIPVKFSASAQGSKRHPKGGVGDGVLEVHKDARSYMILLAASRN